MFAMFIISLILAAFLRNAVCRLYQRLDTEFIRYVISKYPCSQILTSMQNTSCQSEYNQSSLNFESAINEYQHHHISDLDYCDGIKSNVEYITFCILWFRK